MAEAYTAKEDPKAAAVQCKARYEQLKIEREPYLQRARDAAELTIPSIMPPEGHNGASVLRTPFESAGAEGVNSLSSKLLLALLPPGSSFFRLAIDDMKRDEAVDNGDDSLGEIEKALGKVEKAVLKRLEKVGARIAVFNALKHLIVCGNVLVQILDDTSLRLHHLDHYVVKRDGVGHVLEIITHERIAKMALPPQAQAICEEHTPDADEAKDDANVDIYTRVRRTDGDNFEVYQELYDQRIPGSEGIYPVDKTPWLPLRWIKVDGQDYGRGRVEEFIGDIASCESLSQSVTEGTAMMAKIVFMMDGTGVTQKEDLVDATNGEVIEGRKDDVDVLQVEKFADFQMAVKQVEKLEKRIEKNFLVHQQRDAERVTAEEVRAVIAELEKALGGVYAVLSQEFQLPLVKRVLHQMQGKNEIPRLPEKLVSPTIITGLDALGRGADYEKLRLFVADLGQQFGPEAAAEYINVGAFAQRTATALQIDVEGVVRSEEEVQQARQAKQQASLVEKLGPALFKNGQQPQPNAEAEAAA